MRQNSQITVMGENIMLLPYKRHMVPKYHEWMKSSELLQLTASEPLSLEEEYEMQRKWLEDDDKCTFIILDFELFKEKKDEIESMIGDTNLFFMPKDDNDGLCTAEAEIMIAESCARRKRRGWEAMILMLLYGILELKVQKYQAKIGVSNSASIQMFKKLGFKELMKAFQIGFNAMGEDYCLRQWWSFCLCGELLSQESISDVFQEVTLQKFVDEDWSHWLQEQTKMRIAPYYHD